VARTAVFLFIIMGATSSKAPSGFAPIAIGLCLPLIHLISIPVTNTSIKPAPALHGRGRFRRCAGRAYRFFSREPAP
jgi:glycerol uptake facilitator-like aquaporin